MDSGNPAPPGAPSGSVINRIINAAISTVTENSSSNVAMADVAAAAGVSRSTLYRYFPTREALIEGLFNHFFESYRSRLLLRIAERPQVEDRIKVLSEFFEEELLTGPGQRMYGADIGLMLRLTAHMMERAETLFQEVLAPVFDANDAISKTPIDRGALAQIFVRFQPMHILFPYKNPRSTPAEMYARTLRALLRG